jgi:hypothetical protein
LRKPGFTGSGGKKSKGKQRPDLETDEDGRIRLPFGRLDEPAVSWKGDMSSLEDRLASAKEAERRKRDLDVILANPGYRELAIRQLEVGIDRVKHWEARDPEKFGRQYNRFVIERVLAELHHWARLVTQSEWPELFHIIAEYHRLKRRTAPLRYCLISQASQDASEA